MNPRQSGAPGPPEDEAAQRADLALHRRGSDVESVTPTDKDHDEEHLHTDETEEEAEQRSSEESVDETDMLSMGGPDSIEDIEGGDDVED